MLGFGLNVSDRDVNQVADLYQTTTFQTVKAAAAEAWSFNPTVSAFRYYDLQQTKLQAREENDEMISKDILNQQYQDIGLKFEEDEYQSVVDVMVEAKEAELERQSIIQRGPKGFLPGAARLGASFAASAFDLINLGTAFMSGPIFGTARYAQLASRVGLNKARLAKGVTEGAVLTAAVEPLVYGVAKTFQADYDLSDSFMNITFGGLISGGLHVGAGKLKDIGTARRFRKQLAIADKEELPLTKDQRKLDLYREYFTEDNIANVMKGLREAKANTRINMIRKSLDDMLNGRPVDVSTVASHDPALRDMPDMPKNLSNRLQPTRDIESADLNDVEFNVIDKESTDIDNDITILQERLTSKRTEQPEINLDKLLPKNEINVVTRATKELDDFNKQQAKIEEITAAGANCMNGR